MNWNVILLPSAFLALFGLSAFAFLWWGQRKRGTRAPFSRDLRLLRTPGESQLKDVMRFDEGFLSMWLLGGFAPAVMAIILLVVSAHLPGWWFWVGVGLTVAGFAVALILAARWLTARLKQRSERYLGFFGERVVAEFLEPMKSSGWRIFHDVPCEMGHEKFNIDHVAVGPGGVYAIETRTRPKEKARDGRDDYKVFFDGEQLSWPWGEDLHGIVPAMSNAKWLQNWLVKTAGVLTEVVPVLALPGWSVEAPARAALRVVNPSWLPDVLAANGTAVLSAKQVDLCVRQVEQRCRDVEY
jgi:hypothetical protein